MIIFATVSEAFALEFIGKMQNKNGLTIDVALATTREEQTKGLSGIKSNLHKPFKLNEGSLKRIFDLHNKISNKVPEIDIITLIREIQKTKKLEFNYNNGIIKIK